MKKKLFSIALALVVLLGLSSKVAAATIRFYDRPNGSQVGTMNNVQGTVDITVAEPERDGYRFIGWTENHLNIAIDGNTLTASPMYIYGRPSYYYSADVYAMWATLYTITYDLDGGEAQGNPASYTSSDTVVINDPTKEGYEFLGWLDEQGQDLGKNLQLEEGSEGNRTFTATWEEVQEPEEVVEETDELGVGQPEVTTENPNTGVNTSIYVALMLIGLTSFVGLSVFNKKSNN